MFTINYMWIHPTFPQASFVLSVVSFYLLRADLNELPVLKGFFGDPNPDANSRKASYEGSSPRTGTASRERMGAQAQVTPWAWRKPTSENCMLNNGINMLNQDGLITSCCTMFDWWLHIYNRFNRYTWFDLICYVIWYVLQVWYMYYTWWLCVKLADADLRQVLAGLGLEMEQLRLKLSCAVQVTLWSRDALHRQTWHVFVLSNHVLLSFNVIKILRDYMAMINYYLLVEGSLNRNFRQYGQLKSRLE